MERIWRKNEKEVRAKKNMHTDLPDCSRGGDGTDFPDADRPYHHEFLHVSGGDHIELRLNFPEDGHRRQAVYFSDGQSEVHSGYGYIFPVCDGAL